MKTSADTDARFAFIFRRIVSRLPSPAEQKVLRRMLDEQSAVYRADEKAAKKLLAVGSAPTDAKLDAAEHAAWTNLCCHLESGRSPDSGVSVLWTRSLHKPSPE